MEFVLLSINMWCISDKSTPVECVTENILLCLKTVGMRIKNISLIMGLKQKKFNIGAWITQP